MNNPTHTFDPAQVLVSFHGYQLSGFADGTFIQAERDSDSFSKVVGADGEVARVKSADDSGVITFTVLQTSTANDILSAELAKDELSGANIGPVFVKDLRGRTLIQGDEAWLVKPASVSFGKETSDREWKIAVAHMRLNVGGNT
jgi:hypothetical protein